MLPQRVGSLVWVRPVPRALAGLDYPWGVGTECVERDGVDGDWGTEAYARLHGSERRRHGEARGREDSTCGYLARLTRRTCTPDVAEQLNRMWYWRPTAGVSCHGPVPPAPARRSSGRRPGPDDIGAHVADWIPDSTAIALRSGDDDHSAILRRPETIRNFVGVERPPDDLETVLATVLFTDIVDSTRRSAALGDREWNTLRRRHDEIVRDELSRHRGREIKTMGDGFLATFEGPARGVHCARAIADRVLGVGIEIRAGLHTGEIELDGDDIAGIAVSIGARIGAMAGPSEVLVSRTVRDLTAGSGLAFTDAGEHELKGVPDRWQLYRIT